MIFLSCYKIVAWLKILKWGPVFLEGSLKGTVFSFSCLSKLYNTCSTHCIGFLKLDHFSFFFFLWFIHLSQRNFYWNTIIFLIVRENDLSSQDQGEDISMQSWRGLILSSWFTSKQPVFSGMELKSQRKKWMRKLSKDFIIFSWSANKCIFHHAFQLFCFLLIYCSLGEQFSATNTIL